MFIFGLISGIFTGGTVALIVMCCLAMGHDAEKNEV